MYGVGLKGTVPDFRVDDLGFFGLGQRIETLRFRVRGVGFRTSS